MKLKKLFVAIIDFLLYYICALVIRLVIEKIWGIKVPLRNFIIIVIVVGITCQCIELIIKQLKQHKKY